LSPLYSLPFSLLSVSTPVHQHAYKAHATGRKSRGSVYFELGCRFGPHVAEFVSAHRSPLRVWSRSFLIIPLNCISVFPDIKLYYRNFSSGSSPWVSTVFGCLSLELAFKTCRVLDCGIDNSSTQSARPYTSIGLNIANNRMGEWRYARLP